MLPFLTLYQFFFRGVNIAKRGNNSIGWQLLFVSLLNVWVADQTSFSSRWWYPQLHIKNNFLVLYLSMLNTLQRSPFVLRLDGKKWKIVLCGAARFFQLKKFHWMRRDQFLSVTTFFLLFCSKKSTNFFRERHYCAQ